MNENQDTRNFILKTFDLQGISRLRNCDEKTVFQDIVNKEQINLDKQ